MALKVSVVTFCIHLRLDREPVLIPELCVIPAGFTPTAACHILYTPLLSDWMEGAGLHSIDTCECQHPGLAENITFCEQCAKVREILFNYISCFYSLSSNVYLHVSQWTNARKQKHPSPQLFLHHLSLVQSVLGSLHSSMLSDYAKAVFWYIAKH